MFWVKEWLYKDNSDTISTLKKLTVYPREQKSKGRSKSQCKCYIRDM